MLTFIKHRVANPLFGNPHAPPSRPYHVYANDEFVSAHQAERSAFTAARRGSKRRRGVEYRVVRADSYGDSDLSRGELLYVYTSLGGETTESP